MKYKHQQAIDEFREKFVKNVTKQVDTSNSIVLPMWKDNHSHLSRDIEQFLDEQLSKKEEEVIERMRNMSASQRRYLLFPEKFKVQARTPHRRLIQRHSKHRTSGRYRDDCELCQKEFLKS